MGREVPIRNPHFTGRERELALLRQRLSESAEALVGQPAQAIYGLGGIGKTEIAAEYAHRYAADYEVIWWVRAEQEDTIRNAIVSLGRRMQLPEFDGDGRDHSAQVVLDALRRGEPYSRVLLIFDNATQPEVVRKYIPHGNSDVIITSRLQSWRQAVRDDGIEVGQFALDETVEFLRKRVPALGPAEDPQLDAERRKQAEELAETLGNLPLAAEHAAAYLTQTGGSVEEYITRFQQDAHDLLAEGVDMYYPDVVATTWRLSRQMISPEADELFKLLAFFSPEPISEKLLVQPAGSRQLTGLLGKVLSSVTEFRRAYRELARYSLIKIDGYRNVLQIHRVVQAVTKSRIRREDPQRAAELRDTVHMLLAASDPLEPEDENNDDQYERSRQHLIPAEALDTDNPHLRNLVINQVRRLDLRGGYDEALSLGQAALGNWRERLGPDDLQVLSLATEVAVVLRDKGRFNEAYDLNADTLSRLRRVYGETNEVYLECARRHGLDIRYLGRYGEALEHEMALLPLYERVFQPEHHSSLMIRNNIAVSLRCLGRFAEALTWDERTRDERARLLGHTNTDVLDSMFAIARDLRGLGRYEESLDLLREVMDIMERKGEPWHRRRLLIAADMAVALRRVGLHEQAHTLAEDALRRHRAMLGDNHRQTLVVATNLIVDHRIAERLADAQSLGEETVRAWEKVAGPHHPNTYAARANLATVLRHRGNPTAARQLNERCLEGLREAFGSEHPSPITVMINLASDLAALGESNAARELGETAVRLSRETGGEAHPMTLAAMANLALDRRACGDIEASDELFEETMARYREAFTDEYWEARRAAQRGRLDADIEPMSA